MPPKLLTSQLKWTVASLVCAGSLACSPPMYAGGGSDTEVSGRIVAPDGAGIPGAGVTLVPADFNPAFGGQVPGNATDTTDSTGTYRFKGIHHGTYDLQALGFASGLRLLASGIVVQSDRGTLVLSEDSLRKSVRLLVNLPDSLVQLSGYVIATGTTMYAKKNTGDKSVMFDSVAQGVYPGLQFEANASGPAVQLFANVTVGPSDTTVLNPFPGWAHSAKIQINTSNSGVPVQTAVVDFSLVVRLSASNFTFSQAQPGGADLRFAKANGKALPYEIAEWDTAAVIWLSLDTVYPESALQFVRMFWGNTSATALSNPPAVFDTGRGFAGVWHLEEDQAGVGTPGLYKDATPNAANGNDYVSSTGKDGFVGKGQVFAQRDSIPTDAPVTDMAAAGFTACAWVNLSAPGGVVFSKRKDDTMADSGDKELWFGDSAATGAPGLRPTFRAIGQGAITAQRDMPLNQWHYYAFRWQPSTGTATFFVDGGLCGSTGSYSPQAADSPTALFTIGSDGTRSMIGALDEIHLSKVARSDDWIMLAFENQRQDQHVVTVILEK